MTAIPRHPYDTAATCDLCHDRRPAAAPEATAQSAITPGRRALLCAPCGDDRPGRSHPDLLAEDFTWRAMTRRATRLADDYAAGRWLPYEEEHRWAHGLARTYWTRDAVDAALHDPGSYVRAGRLVRVVQPLPTLLTIIGDGDRALRPVRALVDALAHPGPTRP
ncbi:hypothetical protein AB0C96_25465 [Streptomyces sp. NPDC048506]|uniref:hypothetical protein n=1 Tax=Streptomyces sp. NPDC048506 TaxID=3155028 RepID=UPI00344A9427